MKNEYIIDWQLLKRWTNESQYRGINLAFFIGWCVFFLGSLVFGSILIAANMHFDALFSFPMALFCFYRAFFRNIMIAKRQYKRFVQIYAKDSWVRSIIFDDEEIILKEEKTEIKYDYADIREIIEKDDRIYLKVQAKTVIRLYKSKFVDCTWENCKSKILEMNPNIKCT